MAFRRKLLDLDRVLDFLGLWVYNQIVMSAEAPKNTGITASVTPQRPEGGFSRFLRKIFDVPLKSQQTQQSIQPTQTIVQPSQELARVVTCLPTESRSTISEADLPIAEEPFNLEVGLKTLVDTVIREQEDARKIRETQKENERLESEARAQQGAERITLIRARNEKGKVIIAESGARELIERARIGLIQLYPNTTSAEEWGDQFDTVWYGVYDNLPPSAPKRKYISGSGPIIDFETPEDRQRHQIIKQRQEEQDELYDKQGKRLYKIRLAWSEYDNTEPIRNIMDRSKDPYDDSFSYIDILGDGWSNKLVVRSDGIPPTYERDRVFEEQEWRDPNKLAQVIFEAIKSPCHMSRHPDRSGGGNGDPNRPFGGYGGGGG